MSLDGNETSSLFAPIASGPFTDALPWGPMAANVSTDAHQHSVLGTLSGTGPAMVRYPR